MLKLPFSFCGEIKRELVREQDFFCLSHVNHAIYAEGQNILNLKFILSFQIRIERWRALLL